MASPPTNGSTPTLSASTLLSQSDRSDGLFDALTDAAQIVLRRRFRVVLLVRDAYDRMVTNASVLEAVWDDLQTIMRLLVAWAEDSYRRVPWTPLVLMAAALLYFVLPVDVIPDFLAGIGFVDDVAVISSVVQSVRDELDRFRDWEDADDAWN
jgi:uncharacterized membrane protein YkvA (DUF1232 family)